MLSFPFLSVRSQLPPATVRVGAALLLFSLFPVSYILSPRSFSEKSHPFLTPFFPLEVLFSFPFGACAHELVSMCFGAVFLIFASPLPYPVPFQKPKRKPKQKPKQKPKRKPQHRVKTAQINNKSFCCSSAKDFIALRNGVVFGLSRWVESVAV